MSLLEFNLFSNKVGILKIIERFDGAVNFVDEWNPAMLLNTKRNIEGHYCGRLCRGTSAEQYDQDSPL